MIYLDNNATTQPATEISSIISKCLKENFGNPSSGHPFGSKAREAVDRARKEVAGLIGARPDEIIFTSGGTEANNMAIIGTALKHGSGHIISSAIEHPSVMNPLKHLETLGYNVTYIPADKYGMVDPTDVIKKIRKSTILITIMHSNNETGTIQPIARIGEIARKKGIPFHCDAAQSVGKVPVNVKKLNTDMLTIVSHKFYGPKGVGALYLKSGTEIEPVTFGASHERGLRPGTENVCSIAGLGTACRLAKKEMSTRVINMKSLSRLFYSELKKQIPGLKLNGHPSKRLPNTLNLSFPNVIGSALLEKLKNDIAASTGSACHEGQHTTSYVLKAMGMSDKDAFSAVRLSLGRTTTEAQVRKAVKAIVGAYRELV
ncbi:MAG TPA: cysteine desulfurase [Nitrospirae bacterium]|nr:cysteine desulfurase [Nitrospirota bacterium]HDO67529.1 cysteine desulfurase [Nitrospirota bacterium]HEW81703.1 cysteine desulfurase [Nitrospirota bacterium]